MIGSTQLGDAVGGGKLGGLVPYKTSGNAVSFSKTLVARRRLNRLKKSVWASGHLHGLAQRGHRGLKVWFVTLTYRGVKDWSARHISEAIRGYRRWCSLRGAPCRYTWVAELQSRGAVHYHLLAWLPPGLRMPKWDRRTVSPAGMRCDAWWPHGMTNTQPAKAGVGYLMKYLSKLGDLTIFPRGLRLYGIGGLDVLARSVRSWLNWPEWVKREHGVGDCFKSGRDWVVRRTGEVLAPAYQVLKIPDGLQFVPLRPLPDRFHHGAYSSVSF